MWKVAQVAIQGQGHVLTDIPCQDKTFYILDGNKCTISLADGAGSAKLSHLGADCVVKCISGVIHNRFDEFYSQSNPGYVRHEVLSALLQNLKELSVQYGCNLKDLASTILCVAVSEDRYLIVHLGDGVIGYKDGDVVKVASEPFNDEFCNSTIFSTSIGAEQSIVLKKGQLGEGVNGFVMFSDGVESLLYNHHQKEISQSLLPLFDDLSQLEASEVEQNLYETLDEIRNHTRDDCSIIVMAKAKQEGKMIRLEPDFLSDSSVCAVKSRTYLPAVVCVTAMIVISIITVLLAL